MKTKLLLLHGALGNKTQFGAAKALLAEHFEVYDMDFEGHGESPSDKDYSMHVFTENVVAFLQEHSIDKINIFGYSMGGYVALYTALKFPDKVENIVTLGTKFNWEKEAAAQEVRMLNPEKIEAKVPRFAEQLMRAHPAQDWKDVVHKTASMMLGLAEREKFTAEELGQIQHRATIGIGSLDKMVGLEESQHAAALLPNASLKQLEGVEHPIEKMAPDALAEFVVEALR